MGARAHLLHAQVMKTATMEEKIEIDAPVMASSVEPIFRSLDLDTTL